MEQLLARYFGNTPLGDALTGVLVPTYEIERHTPFWVLVQPVKTGITPPLAIPSCGQEGEKGRLRRAERLHERQ